MLLISASVRSPISSWARTAPESARRRRSGRDLDAKVDLRGGVAMIVGVSCEIDQEERRWAEARGIFDLKDDTYCQRYTHTIILCGTIKCQS